MHRHAIPPDSSTRRHFDERAGGPGVVVIPNACHSGDCEFVPYSGIQVSKKQNVPPPLVEMVDFKPFIHSSMKSKILHS